MQPIQIWRRGDAEYPDSLEKLASPPAQLFALGSSGMLAPPLVSIVGTRNPTAYGLRMARAIAGSLAQAGVSVVSGMARGIDATVHRAALEVGGRTVAVMGTGIDIPYPVGHRELYNLLSEKALVISENGCGVRAQKGAFPKRNRIIAALAPLTIVIEAGVISGALNTANQAGSMGNRFAAVPGPIDSPQSMGANQLIREGASIVTDITDVFSLLHLAPPPRTRELDLDERQKALLIALGDGTLDADTLATRSGLPARECLTVITSLELLGVVECMLTGEIRRR